jgi:S1-C subfamily serine protease
MKHNTMAITTLKNAAIIKRWSLSVIFFLLILPITHAANTHAANADTEFEPKAALDAVKAELSKSRFSKVPDSSMVTRSPEGPRLFRSTVKAVVRIIVVEEGPDGELHKVSDGSGVVVSEGGMILTNWHVVGPKDYIVVMFYPGPNNDYSEISEKDVWVGHVVKREQTRDLALIQLLASKDRRIPSDLKAIPLEDPARLEVGQDVFAIGHPGGLQWSYTEGVISQIRPRYEWKDDGGEHRAEVIQTQTVLSFGSSGGPLINRDGKLIGIVQSINTEHPGIILAISVYELNSFLGR